MSSPATIQLFDIYLSLPETNLRGEVDGMTGPDETKDHDIRIPNRCSHHFHDLDLFQGVAIFSLAERSRFRVFVCVFKHVLFWPQANTCLSKNCVNRNAPEHPKRLRGHSMFPCFIPWRVANL